MVKQVSKLKKKMNRKIFIISFFYVCLSNFAFAQISLSEINLNYSNPKEYIIGGIPTTINVLSDILKTEEFINSQIHVKFLEENFKIRDIKDEEISSDRPSKVKISLDDNNNPTLAPQRPKKIGMDLTGNIRNPGLIFAEMQGTIMETMTKQGKKVKKGDSLFVLEAMKMENVITSPIDGVIKTYNVQKGQAVKKGDLLVEIEIRF